MFDLKNQQNFIKFVEKLIDGKLRQKEREWYIGTIQGVFSKNSALVTIQGQKDSVEIPTNPNVQFFPGEQVLVLYINGNPKNKYVMSKCATGKEQ